jgi:hypothetical protein
LRVEVNFIAAETVRKGIQKRQYDDANDDEFGCKDAFHGGDVLL